MKEKEFERLTNLKEHERELRQKGFKNICGIDEAGRGPLAGPVVIASVIMPADSMIEGVNDSKKVSEKKRELLYDKIIEEVKDQKLKGTALENCNENIKNAAKNAGIEDAKDYYYLSQEDLNNMGINIEVPEETYYLVKYNFEDIEVVYTGGYKFEGVMYYKLSEMKNIEL